MTDDALKGQVKGILKNLFGLEAEELPERLNRRTPDFRVTSRFGDLTFLELKAKGDDLEQTAKEREGLNQGGVVSRSVPLTRRNTLSGIIEDGVEQLRDYPIPADAFSVLWCHSWGRDAELLMDRFRATLFGTTNIIDMGPTKDTRFAFYFGFNDFYRFRDTLDGALLSTEVECQLCINSLSPRAELFRKSGFVQAFARGLCDPSVLEKREEAYLVDGDVDRRNEHEVLNYLRTKYDRDRLLNIDLTYHSAAIAAPESGHELG